MRFAWRYSLHPGLWCLERLGALARAVETLNPPGGKKRLELRANGEQRQLRRGSWVCQYLLPGMRLSHDRQPTRYLRYRAAYLSLLTVQTPAINAEWTSTDRRRDLNAIGYYYEGPYPLFWSGLIVQGRFNPALSRYIAIARRRDLRRCCRATP